MLLRVWSRAHLLNKMNKKQGGYTFSEVIIVLVALSVLLAIAAPLNSEVVSSVKITHYIEQLENDILLAQQLSMQHESHYWIMIRPENNDYYLYDYSSRKSVFHRKLPEKWSIRLTTLQSPIRFNTSGTIQNPGTMVLKTPESSYKITFPFGKSRVTIHEQ
ncbi:prepilin-type N-terminal cleavage/methylation domain-containing protein [Halobacillus shinanisalinarum]|uniref:Prepilin-type N-terminal cleavage/methylation domain-containing protein n=1 Tax=Halobacillus shinanisalinarum TaxID=2932258 RepID=A0ABY4H1D5_9BACI|nr:prepilin-type N-terminal cleavage/methylation domain-containing protein [Halobacillus shinanisalinarum]UOQ93725.1 prepilin-type N-terminal cleavage/methylation domain-containing protein [Halobacillus shinanisalinarum]